MTEYTANPHQDFESLEDLSDFLDEANIHSNCVLRFFQLNQHRSETVDQQTKNFVLSTNQSVHSLDSAPLICLLQEPYYHKQGSFYSPDSQYASPIYLKKPGVLARAAIWCPTLYNPRPIYQLMTRDVAAAAITVGNESFTIFSIYRPQNQDPAVIFSNIEGNFSSSHLSACILGANMNCKSALWAPSSSVHGESIEGFAIQNNLTCINPPNHDPTFIGANGSSHIDA